MASNINNAQVFGHTQNLLHNLKNCVIQFTDHKKVPKKVTNSRNQYFHI